MFDTRMARLQGLSRLDRSRVANLLWAGDFNFTSRDPQVETALKDPWCVPASIASLCLSTPHGSTSGEGIHREFLTAHVTMHTFSICSLPMPPGVKGIELLASES